MTATEEPLPTPNVEEMRLVLALTRMLHHRQYRLVNAVVADHDDPRSLAVTAVAALASLMEKTVAESGGPPVEEWLLAQLAALDSGGAVVDAQAVK